MITECNVLAIKCQGSTTYDTELNALHLATYHKLLNYLTNTHCP